MVELDALSSTKAEPNFPFQMNTKGFVYSPWVHLLWSVVGGRLQTKDIKLLPLTESNPVPRQDAERPSHALF